MTSPQGTAAAEWTLATVTMLLLFLRFYVRRYIAKTGLQREDFLLLAAQLLFFCWISMDAFTISQGFMDDNRSYFDNFVTDIQGSDEKKIRLLKVVYSSAVPYYLDLWVIKFAILGLYDRLVPKGTKTRWLLIATTVFTGVLGLAVILINVLLCQPISSNWSLDWDHACYSSTAITPFVISAVGNLITDICIFIIPFPVLRGLKTLTRKQKIGLVVTFSLGAVTIIVCIARAIVIALEGSISNSAVLTAIEVFTALTVATLPSLKILLKARPFRRSTRKSDMSDAEENMTTTSENTGTGTGTGGGGGMYAPRSLPIRQQEKHAFDPMQPHGESYVIHEQPLGFSSAVSPPPEPTTSPSQQSFRNDNNFVLDDDDYSEQEHVQMVSLNGGRGFSPNPHSQQHIPALHPTANTSYQMDNASIGSHPSHSSHAHSPPPLQQQSMYQQQQPPYGAFPTASINNFRRAQPNSSPQMTSQYATRMGQSTVDGDYHEQPLPQPPLNQHYEPSQDNRQQPKRDPFMPDYLNNPPPPPTI